MRCYTAAMPTDTDTDTDRDRLHFTPEANAVFASIGDTATGMDRATSIWTAVDEAIKRAGKKPGRREAARADSE